MEYFYISLSYCSASFLTIFIKTMQNKVYYCKICLTQIKIKYQLCLLCIWNECLYHSLPHFPVAWAITPPTITSPVTWAGTGTVTGTGGGTGADGEADSYTAQAGEDVTLECSAESAVSWWSEDGEVSGGCSHHQHLTPFRILIRVKNSEKISSEEMLIKQVFLRQRLVP